MRSVMMFGLLVALRTSPALATQTEPVSVAFRLPDRAGLAIGTELMDAYHVQAKPSGCSEAVMAATRPYAAAGEMQLDPRCDWQVTLSLGSGAGDGLSEVYYQSAGFFLRRDDLAGKVKLELSFQFRRQEAGTARGFKPAILL